MIVTAMIVSAMPVSAAGIVGCMTVMTKQLMSSRVVATIESPVITVFAAGVVTYLSGHHAENHVAEAQHRADDI
jgi:hypothetical protein